jgi:single-strand DNA-binding protein
MNKVMLMGRLAYDVDLKKTQSGLSVANMKLVTNERVDHKTTTETKTHSEWHNMVAWGVTADTCANYLKKGSLVFVEGKIRSEQYEKDGAKVKTTKIVVDNIKFLQSESSF